MALAEQSDRFKEAARDIGADESEAAFREKLAAVARISLPGFLIGFSNPKRREREHGRR